MGQTNAIILFCFILVVLAAVSWLVIRFGRGVPPALSSPAADGRFGGALLIFIVGQCFWFLSCLAQSCYFFTELWFLLERSAEALRNGAAAVLPMLAVLAMSAAVLWLAALKRTQAVPGAIVVMLWLMGPGATMLRSLYFELPYDTAADIARTAWVAAWTVYLALSPRVALLYGTPRGRRMAEGGKAWEIPPLWKRSRK